MRMKSLIGTLWMFLLTIGFVSCDSGDDQLKYHLELSQNSCEVMQGSQVTISLITHENTELEIGNPELIDAVYTWEANEHKANIEITGKEKGETDIVVTNLETRESATIKIKVLEYPIPYLAVKQSRGNIFDTMVFYLYTKDDKAINPGILASVCDSVVWTIDGMNGSFRVFDQGKGDGWTGSQLTFEWGHCFLYSGEYKTNLAAWKDNKVILSRQLEVPISDHKDFLAYNWRDITKESQAWSAYADVLMSSPNLKTGCGISGTTPYAEVRVFAGAFAETHDILYDYISKIYSSPTYVDTTEKQKMWQRYEELFSEQKKYPNAYPVAIWLADRANIVLLMRDESTESPGYLIYAEPKR